MLNNAWRPKFVRLSPATTARARALATTTTRMESVLQANTKAALAYHSATVHSTGLVMPMGAKEEALVRQVLGYALQGNSEDVSVWELVMDKLGLVTRTAVKA